MGAFDGGCDLPPARARAGNRAMTLQANVTAPPSTVVDAERGVVTAGAATLSFYLAEPASGAAVDPAGGGAQSGGGDSRGAWAERAACTSGKKHAFLFPMLCSISCFACPLCT